MTSWFENRWGWYGILGILILYSTGALVIFPIFQAFGSLFLVGAFPILLFISIPVLIFGWFFGLLAEKIYRSLR